MTKKKYIVITVIVVLISIIALIGSTYALLTTRIEGNKTVSLTAGILKVDFEEGNRINLENVAPISDSAGQKGTPYTFTITNNGNINAYYRVKIEEDSTNTLSNSYLKMRITGDNGYDSGVVRVSRYGELEYEIIGEDVLEPEDTVTYKLWMWLDIDADNSAQGKIYQSKIVVESFDRKQGVAVSNVLLENIPEDNLYDDGTDTFITGENPNNYIWYSGKLWRAVLVNNEARTVKLVTEWNISAISYNVNGNSTFDGSHMKTWLNDETEDGFLENLREPDKFIKMDSKWNASMMVDNTKPNDTTIVTSPVGLLNMYEYQISYQNTDYNNGYLNNDLAWFLLTPYSSASLYYVTYDGNVSNCSSSAMVGIRPAINLKSSVRIISGSGTEDNPYRLAGDNDTNLYGTKLNTRYSGEYIRFGGEENNLYRIVSHETEGLTKITSAEPLKENDEFKASSFDSNGNINYSSSTTIGSFLNEKYLTDYIGIDYVNMIEDNSLWYLGTIVGGDSYLLAKYTNINMNELATSINAKIGLLRLGELMAGQFNKYENNITYTNLTKYEGSSYLRAVNQYGVSGNVSPTSGLGIKPTMNLKANVVITGGTGTKEDPFIVELG